MLRRRRKTDFKDDEALVDPARYSEVDVQSVLLQEPSSGSIRDYFKFAFYCILLAVPLYAITMSILKQDWVMVFVDALIVPVGFVHGLLLLLGFVN